MNLECIIKQYSNFNDEDSGMKLDGNRTNIEDIADNIGVSLAYQTYIDVVERNLKDNKREETLIAFKDYNPKQLFWISFAQFYCSVHRKGYNKKQLEQAEAIHTLNEFRVKGPLQNSKQFAKDFNCKEGTVMNPDSKCSIW
jgi:neprilysin